MDIYTAFYYDYKAKNDSNAWIEGTKKVPADKEIIEDIFYKSKMRDYELNESISVYVNQFGRVDAVEGESFFMVVTET